MGSNTRIFFHKILLQSRSKWLRSKLETQLPANQVKSVVETNQLEEYYYTEELSNQILEQLLNDTSQVEALTEVIFSQNQSPEQIFYEFMGNQQQTIGGMPQLSQSPDTTTQGKMTLFNLGEQLNTPIIGKCAQFFFFFIYL